MSVFSALSSSLCDSSNPHLYPSNGVGGSGVLHGDLRALASQSFEEEAMIKNAMSALEDMLPNDRLADLLSSTTLTPSVAAEVLLEIGKKKLAMDKVLLCSLFTCLPHNVAQACLSQLMRSGVYPPMVYHLERFASYTHQVYSHDVAGPLYQDRCQKLEKLAVKQLCQTQAQPEAQNQFRYYAMKVVRQQLNLTLPRWMMMLDWIEKFISEAAEVSFDDGIQLSSLVARARLSREFLASGLDLFIEGTWNPAHRSVAGLITAIVEARQTVRHQCELILSPPPSVAGFVESVRQSIYSGVIRRAFAGVRSGGDIDRIEQLVQDKIDLLASQALIVGSTACLRDSIIEYPENKHVKTLDTWVVKVRLFPQAELSMTVATPQGIGSFNIVWKVARIAGVPHCGEVQWPVFSYAKSHRVIDCRNRIREGRREAMVALAERNIVRVQSLQQRIFTAVQEEAHYRALMMQGMTMAIEIGEGVSVPTEIVWKAFNPSVAKGKAMASMDGTLLSFDWTTLPLEERLKVARDICGLVAKMHDRHFVHLDLGPSNVLVTTGTAGTVVALNDFDTARKLIEKDVLCYRTATYPPPEMACATERSPIPVVSSLDDWPLGIIVSQVVLGSPCASSLVVRDGSPKSAEQMHDELKKATARLPETVRNALFGLLEYTPVLRWTACRAVRALQEGIDQLNLQRLSDR
jgi:hypothetical protein